MKPEEVQFAQSLEAMKAPQCRRLIQSLSIKNQTLEELAATCKLSIGSVEKQIEILLVAEVVLVENVSPTAIFSKYDFSAASSKLVRGVGAPNVSAQPSAVRFPY